MKNNKLNYLDSAVKKLNKLGYKVIDYSSGELFDGDVIKMILPKEEIFTEHFRNVSYVPKINTEIFIIFKDISLLPNLPQDFLVVGNMLYKRIEFVTNFDSFFDDKKLDTFKSSYKIEEEIISACNQINDWVDRIGDIKCLNI